MSMHTFRYTRGIKAGSVIRARDGVPLDLDQLRAAVPSIFATEAHESRSQRFAAVPTINVLTGLQKEGFDVFQAAQAGTRDEGRKDFTKHMLRLRHRSLENQRGEAFEIVLVNANDGTSAYQMIPGFFRFVCANGLMTGDTFEEVKVRHSGNAVSDVIEGAFRVLDASPLVTDQVARFHSTMISDDERQVLADAALVLRFPDKEPEQIPVKAASLLRPRRSEDRDNSLWTAFNVVQENVIRGGLKGRVQNEAGQIRRATTREVAGIDQNRALNRALWMLTERMAALKLAA